MAEDAGGWSTIESDEVGREYILPFTSMLRNVLSCYTEVMRLGRDETNEAHARECSPR